MVSLKLIPPEPLHCESAYKSSSLHGCIGGPCHSRYRRDIDVTHELSLSRPTLPPPFLSIFLGLLDIYTVAHLRNYLSVPPGSHVLLFLPTRTSSTLGNPSIQALLPPAIPSSRCYLSCIGSRLSFNLRWSTLAPLLPPQAASSESHHRNNQATGRIALLEDFPDSIAFL